MVLSDRPDIILLKKRTRNHFTLNGIVLLRPHRGARYEAGAERKMDGGQAVQRRNMGVQCYVS